MPPYRLADKISENVSRPNHQQQVQQIKSPGPLLPELYEHPHGQRNVGECKDRSCSRRVAAAQILVLHRACQKNKRRDCRRKSEAVHKNGG